MRRLSFVLILALFLSITSFARGKKDNKKLMNLHNRLTEVERSMERLESEMEILKAQSRLVIRRTTIGYLNAMYFRANFSLLLPRSNTFTGSTDTGLGAHIGMGKYLGRNHVFDLGFDWDVYPSVTFKYRIEMHNSNPNISIGPTIGIKQKLFNKGPFDNFLGTPSEAKSTYLVGGFHLGFPLGKSLLASEIVALINGQFILTISAGVHFFL